MRRIPCNELTWWKLSECPAKKLMNVRKVRLYAGKFYWLVVRAPDSDEDVRVIVRYHGRRGGSRPGLMIEVVEYERAVPKGWCPPVKGKEVILAPYVRIVGVQPIEQDIGMAKYLSKEM